MKEFLIKSALSIIAIFAPIQGILISVFVLCASDMVFGILAARKRGEQISSSGLRRTVVKMFVYEIIIALGFIAQRYLMDDLMPICHMISSYIGFTELLSSYENLNEIAGGELLKSLIGKIGKFEAAGNKDKKPE